MMISYDDLTKHIMVVKDFGYPDDDTAPMSARLFGFYLSLLAITGLRNKTVREASFDDFAMITW